MESESVSKCNFTEMPEAEGQEKFCPPPAPTYIGAGDTETWGHVDPPSDYISYRVTTDSADVVYEAFRNCRVVIAHEISKTGVQHYHIVMEGYDQHEMVKKRLIRAKLGVNKWLSKKNHGDVWKAVSYTIKCGDYVTRKGFHEYTDYVEKFHPWQFDFVQEVSDEQKDTDKDWMLTFNNLLRVAHNYAQKKGIKSSNLGVVLAHMTEHTRWIPSPQMMKAGLDPWFFEMYKFRVGDVRKVPDWWTPRSI